MKPGQRTAAQRGLSMIEVLAAMVIFSAGAVVLFGWIGQAAGRLAKLGVEQRKLFGDLAALEFAKTLNPALQPNGDTAIGGVRISWRAVPVGNEAPAYNSGGGVAVYMVQLFRLQLQVQNDPRDPAGASQRSVYLAGWRQLRDARPGNPFATASDASK